MKKMTLSMNKALDEAEALSKRNPKSIYRVMTKHGKRAICTGSDWVYRERIIEGWNTAFEVADGQVTDKRV